MASKYAVIWNTLKKAETVQVTVSKDNAHNVIYGVKREKFKENVPRKLAGLPYWGKLIIKRESISDTHERVTFSFGYSINL